MRGYARKRDANERGIIDALQAAGAAVQQLDGSGIPDLLVSFANELHLVEVKDATETRVAHKRSASEEHPELTPTQVAWWAKWKGRPPVIVQTAEQALRAIGVKL